MILLVSCIEHSSKYRKLKSENEALIAEKANTSALLDEMLTTLNDIQVDIQAIRDAENYLSVEQKGDDFSPYKKEQLKNNVRQIGETLKSNRQQLASLREQLKNSHIRSDALQHTIDRISAELDQKAVMITSLQEELAGKDVRLHELDNLVASLNENIDNLSETTTVQSEKLNEQNRKLNTAYYCLGTEKELKKQNILTGGGLFSRTKALEGFFNEDYFIPIDIREITDIQLFAGKANIRSNHPKETYNYTKDENGNLTLHIVDVNQFWNLSRYLVIEIK
jgi:predicted  nucleic acid-binding Zn-ribbon protein